MIKRSLQDIRAEINAHEAAVVQLQKEIEEFQAACPHPDAFNKTDRKSYDDEYGRIEGYSITHTCLLCGHRVYDTEEVDGRRY